MFAVLVNTNRDCTLGLQHVHDREQGNIFNPESQPAFSNSEEKHLVQSVAFTASMLGKILSSCHRLCH